MSYNQLPTPTSPEIVVVPVTYADNYIPVDFSEIELLISGADLIVQQGVNKLVLPLAAGLSSIDKDVLSFTFKDGVTITSSDLLYNAKVVETSHKFIEMGESTTSLPFDASGEAAQQSPDNESENLVVIIDDLESNLDTSEQGTAEIEKFTSKASMEVQQTQHNEKEEILIVTSSDTPPSGSNEKSKDVPQDNANRPGDNQNASDGIIVAPISLLQTSAIVDNATHTWIGGSGNDDAVTSGNFNVQYDDTHIDLSAETANWTIHVNNTDVIPQGYVGRVVEITDGQSVNSVTGQLSGMTVITGSSTLGQQYGLAPNQFLIIYPEGSNSNFELTFSYINNDGETVSEQANFDVINNPGTIVDSTGHFQLSSTMNNVNVTAGSGDDTIFAGQQNGHYDGGAGNNTVNYSKLDESLTIDLNSGTTTSEHTNQTLTNIQNVVGSDHGDTLIGHQTENNQLIGGAGNDTIMSGGGNNVIDGGAGINTIDYSNVSSGVNVDLTNNIVNNNGEGGTDTITNIQNVTGSDANDIIKGNAQDNIIFGGNGNDVLSGMGGNNTLDGGTGDNTASYADATSGITVDLALSNNQVLDNGFGGVDSLTNIQNIIGSNHDDVFSTTTGSIHINGGAGNDIFYVNGDDASITQLEGHSGNNLYYAGAGLNQYIGGTGRDTVDYSSALSYVNINFVQDIVYDNGFSGIDILTNIDEVIGTNFDDYFVLGNGEHTVNGGLGNNTFIAGTGNNTINGGSDGLGYINTVDYSAATSALNVNLATGDVSANGFGGTDHLTNIQKLIASDFNDIIYSSANDMSILAGAGNDIVYGNTGNDVIDGGEGTNTLRYDALADGVTVNMVSKTVQKTTGIDTYNNFTNFVGSTGNDTFIMSTGTLTVNGSAGVDTVNYRNVSVGVTVRLDTATKTATGTNISHTLNSIENVIFSHVGSVGYTNKTGSTTFTGGNGNDLFYIMGGNNTITGGAGTNTISYQYASSAINTSLNSSGSGSTSVNGYGGSDNLTQIYSIVGTKYNDTIKAAGTINGYGGNDTIEGVGINAVVNYGSSSTVTANLATGIVTKSGGTTSGTDTLTNINHLYTGSSHSTVWGNDNTNRITGRAGNDLIYGSGGNDTLDGGAGNDTLDYSQLSGTTSINMNLTTGAVAKSDGSTDQTKNFESIMGTSQNDTFTLSSYKDLSNFLSIDGGAGNDTVVKSGASSNFSFGQDTVFKHIERFDFNDSRVDNLSVDLASIFTSMDQNRIEFTLDSNDNLLLINSTSWSHTVSGTTETWSDGSNELVVTRV